MSKIAEAQEILKALGLPSAQQNDMSALTLLALCSIKEDRCHTHQPAYYQGNNGFRKREL